MTSSTGSGFAADEGNEERECVFHSGTPSLGREDVSPASPRRAAGSRVSALLLIVWTCASLLACLLAGLLGFVEVVRACDGTAALRFGAGIEVRCHDAGNPAGTPVNAVAAVVLFAGAGLAVTLLLAIWHGIVRAREDSR
ncbi:hypothetical protein [Saccharomonospora cyanea]|uniref:Uncharacterized protein n=1 Tax=Saccharomonospora cyanea NA-134 TaxID=882082 RepID=H5XEX0_9PSEU|nr:hypothetical protein [Saccharomonospora cyanea]EHR60364.1 hypothetical protein SaccyDRAFT_1460 [Saccharomonospora cyanea NA-134]